MEPHGVVEEIESLFIVKKFDEALAKCEQELRNLRKIAQGINVGAVAAKPGASAAALAGSVSAAATQALDGSVLGFDAAAKKPNLFPTVSSSGLSLASKPEGETPAAMAGGFDLVVESQPLVQLMIQLLFETKRSNEIMPFIRDFYGEEVEGVPLEVVSMCIYLQISLGNYAKALEMATKALDRFIDTAQSPDPSELTEDRYNQLLEAKSVHILAASKQYANAEETIQTDMYLKAPAKAELLAKVTQVRQTHELADQQAAIQHSGSSESSDTSSSQSSPSSSPLASPRTAWAIPGALTVVGKNGRPHGHKSSKSHSGVMAAWYSYQKAVLERYQSLSPANRKALYGVIVLLVFGGLFLLSGKLRVLVGSARASVWKWLSEFSGMLGSLNGPQSAQAQGPPRGALRPSPNTQFGTSQPLGVRSRL